MTNRELLELAAKAAGITCTWRDVIRSRVAEFQTIKHTKHSGFFADGKEWNPLEDDGDAFRLQVALQLELEFGACFVNVGKSHGNDGQWHLVRESALDLGAATRRAIVRAAAEIGKQQEQPQ